MESRLDARLASGLAYLIWTGALSLTLFWYRGDRLLWIYAGASALLALLAAVYARRSRFTVVHAAHALLLLVIQVLWFLCIPAALDLALGLVVLTLFSMINALQGYVMDWWLLNWLKRRLMQNGVA